MMGCLGWARGDRVSGQDGQIRLGLAGARSDAWWRDGTGCSLLGREGGGQQSRRTAMTRACYCWSYGQMGSSAGV